MAVNTRGLFECVKAVLPVTRRECYGKIINIASVTVFNPHSSDEAGFLSASGPVL